MAMTISRRVGTVAAAVAASAIVLAGCSTDDSSSDMESTSSAMTSSSAMSSSPSTSESMSADPAAMLVGPGCAEYAESNPDGPGSVDGMAQEPVATAASGNPMLQTLVQALSGGVNPDVDLVDTLNSGEYTVFAPVDDAFAQIDDATMETLKTDPELLTSILTYHVVEGQMTPDEISGTHATLEGGEVEVSGEGDELMVDGASVICGGVQTANATVYMVDQVLMPKM